MDIATNISTIGQIADSLQQMGVDPQNLSLPNAGACEQLRDMLLQAKPCIAEKMCTPFGGQTEFMIWMGLLLFIVFWLGFFLRKYLARKGYYDDGVRKK